MELVNGGNEWQNWCKIMGFKRICKRTCCIKKVSDDRSVVNMIHAINQLPELLVIGKKNDTKFHKFLLGCGC